ncbi:hypothetical protein RJ640_013811 [Escallonia rubra]|uniref:DYW domain-containing protein n=1 Tax=Escallonia rubra TaxID=112253 RepID=A0AA88QF66_9ASTE|nr:hypothetical protein RJ640_013811 [Escallonia rubra]
MSCATARRVISSTRSCVTDPHDYIRLLEACTQSNSLAHGQTVHQHLVKNSYRDSPVVLDKLTRFYISCHQLRLARRVFDTIPIAGKKHNVILWNQMIQAYAWNGPLNNAVELYGNMIENGVVPSKYTYPFVLKACAGLQDVEVGKEVHESVKRDGLESDVYICTALVDFYAKCGCLDDAREVFDKVCGRDVVTWNAMIAGFSLHGMHGDLVRLVAGMQEAGLRPNSSTVVAILPAIGEANALWEGKAAHGYCVRRWFHGDVVVGTGLLDMYAKCGCLSYARRIFDVLGVKNEVTWSAMIGGCVTCDSTREALELFDRVMLEDAMIPSTVMLGIVLRACAKLTDMRRGRRIHGYTIKSGSVLDLMVGNTLVSMYAKCGVIDDVMVFFSEMAFKDTVSYGAVISGYVQNGNAEEALEVFRKMQLSGIKPDLATLIGFLPACSHLAALQHGACVHSYCIVRGLTADTSLCNALIDMYCKCGKIDMARLAFDRTSGKDVVSWNAMIGGYGVHGLGNEAVSLFHDMQAIGVKPDDVTFIGLLSACSHSGLVAEGNCWFAAMSRDFSILPRVEHYLCMVDLLGRAGLLNDAYNLIQKMPVRPDVRIWSALLAACRIHKDIELGEEVSKNIQSLGAEGTGNFVLLSNIYSAAGRWNDAANVRTVQRDKGYKKSPGCSWVEINGVIHAFIGGDRSHPQSTLITKKLDELLAEMKKLGYCAESSFVLHDVEDEEKEKILLYHSEKLAVAFAVLSLSPNKPILVTKNLRVCGDCHTALKFITIITKREITVRDASRFHHFRDGTCNCGDFW